MQFETLELGGDAPAGEATELAEAGYHAGRKPTKYRVPLSWTLWADLVIEANSPEEAYNAACEIAADERWKPQVYGYDSILESESNVRRDDVTIEEEEAGR